jgi:glycosyltransferase involved in cell wall biosynthesis
MLMAMPANEDSPLRVGVYILCPKWFIRPRNTDWRYTRFSIPRITGFAPSCWFHPAQSNLVCWERNIDYACQAFSRRLRWKAGTHIGPALDRKEFERSNCQLVFCHDDFPRDAESIPVVWQNSILDPEMERASGRTETQLESQKSEKERGFRLARFVQVATDAERLRLGSWFPHLAEKFVAIPFFLPDVHAIEESQLNEKLARRDLLRLLFVGHEARRKGLARVYDAVASLSPSLKQRVHLTVVSRYTDGIVSAPSLPNLTLHNALPFRETQTLMRQSDVFVMPSHYESFGLVFLEAMAQGTIPIAPNWEVQREIVDYGRAGLLSDGTVDGLSQILGRLCEDQRMRVSMARNAWQRFKMHFAPEVVARKYSDLFHRATC